MCANAEARQQGGLDLGEKSVAAHMHDGSRGRLETPTFMWVVKRELWVTHRKCGAVGSAWRVMRAR